MLYPKAREMLVNLATSKSEYTVVFEQSKPRSPTFGAGTPLASAAAAAGEQYCRFNLI
jgi:hypothetical protein